MFLYHSEAEADCHEEVELIDNQSCRPYYEIKCVEEEISVEEIVYQKKCREIVDVVCGPPNKVNDDDDEQEKALIKLLAGPELRHNCHDVKREHCYTMPVVQEVRRPAEKCHVVTRVRCNPKVDTVKKIVCNKPKAQVAAYPYFYPTKFLYQSLV